MYHSISTKFSPRYRLFNVTPDEFLIQMRFLVDSGYATVSVTQLVETLRNNASSLPARLAVLTFDDGFLDFYINAWPVLTQLRLNATLYVVTNYIGRTGLWLDREGESDRPMLHWSHIREIDVSGIEVGAHSHTHPELDVIPVSVATREISRCKAVLEDGLGKSVESFAYPYGYYSAAVRSIVKAAGYRSACAVRYQASSTNDDLFALSRLIVKPDLNLDEFHKLLCNTEPVFPPELRRTLAWGWRLIRLCNHLGQDLIIK